MRNDSVAYDVAIFEALRHHDVLWQGLQHIGKVGLPNWYLGAGCVAQTIWNLAHDKAPEADILDYDLVYFDPDVSEERECEAIREAQSAMSGIEVKLDVKNQARVHLWYPSRFGYEIKPYSSVEEAIATWPTTAASIGIRLDDDNLVVEAPFGLGDLMNLVVRANRVQITLEIYAAKVERWRPLWPKLDVRPWAEGVGTPQERWLR